MIKKLLLSAVITATLLEGCVATKISGERQLEEEGHQQKESNHGVTSILLADKLLREGKIGQAEKKLQVAEQGIKKSKQPSDILSRIFQRYGHIAITRGEDKKAAEWYQKAIVDAKKREDKAQVANAFINRSRVTDDGTLLKQAATYIKSLADKNIKQQLQLSLGYQAIQLGELKLALNVLQAVLNKPVNSQFKAQALGYLSDAYVKEKLYIEALNLLDRALLADQRTDLQLEWNWRRAKLLKVQAKNKDALVGYRHAVRQLQQLRIDIPIVYSNGESSFNTTFYPLYSEYITLLLQQSNNTKDKAEQQALLGEVLQAWEALKSSELRDYFREACEAEKKKERHIEKGTAVFYPMVLSDQVSLVVRFSDKIKAYSVDKTSSDITKMINIVELCDLEQGKKDSLALYKLLIAPVEADLKKENIKTLVYLPDGALRRLPFALLHDGEQYLIEKYALATIPGLSFLSEPSKNIRKNNILLAGVSQPGPIVGELLDRDNTIKTDKVDMKALSLALKNKKIIQHRKINDVKRLERAIKLIQTYALPGVAEELETLSALYNTDVMMNEQFLLDDFEKEVEKGYSMIHIASHGYFSGDPATSFMMTHDKLLTMNDLSGIFQNEAFNRKPVELVTLSACQTAKGNDRSPLGMSGLIVRAGVKSTIGSLWPVSDKAAQQFFSTFYKIYQTSGITKVQAVQQAQIELMKNNAPVDWAPFILVGEWH